MLHRPQFVHLDRWPLPRVIVLLLAGGFLGLALDVRVEHVDVVRTRAIAWTPIVYSIVMAFACAASVVLQSDRVRRAMIVLFAFAAVVGGAGFYFHNKGKPARAIQTAFEAWTGSPISHPDDPPPFAPTAFAGLGLIGAVSSLKRYAGEMPVEPAETVRSFVLDESDPEVTAAARRLWE